MEVFGELPKSNVLVLGRLVPLPPREKALEVPVDANGPREGVLDSASFSV